ncbi:MAG: helicase-exonuclease AddAB subunit AddA [Planctomycetota bacterium]|jgi:ATP-dependent helicase/nuclease subunit A
MAEKKIKWTEQQLRAIAERGSDILVTASAGTGKTAVLSGRYVNIISDKSVCLDVWSLLVLTFTNAAAEQMRLRIAGQLHQAFVQSKDERLRYQIMLLPAADISTIHSFCKRLISEHFYKLGLDPTFRVIESDEQNLLKAEALEKTIDWAWQQSNLTQGLGELLYRRDLRTNDGFLAKITDLSNFLDGVISRDKWYERAVRLAEAVNPFTTELGEKQKKIVSDKLQHILEQMRYAQSLYTRRNTDGDWDGTCEQIFIRPVSQCLELLKAGDWDKCAKQIRNFVKPKVYRPKELQEMIGGLIQKTVKKAVDAFEALSEFAVVNPEYLDRISGVVGRQTRVLIELVRKFDRLYTQAKRAANCLDFADLEHYALRLLTNEDSSDDNPSPSETALMLRTKYKYIFVDEYQDINPVQQAILDLLSSEDNIFVVGDVKQSIYGFRGAKSDAFVERLKSASADAKKASRGLRVDLNANFRSAEGILSFVNKIFARIMTGTLAKIEYDESAKLKPTLKQGAAGDSEPVVELHILDEESNSEAESDSDVLSIITSRQRQAAMISRRIKQMVGADIGKAEFKIYDKEQDKIRDIRFSDIVILLRSPSHRVNDYVEVLQLAGVPVSCDTTGGYFEKTEVSDLICLLKVLDNPQRDIELAAVLRSPFFRVSDRELAEIKICGKANEQCKNFYDCVLHYAGGERKAKLAKKLKKYLEQIEKWRNLARAGSLADLIWLIYRQSGMLSFVCALPNGPQRKANLLKLHDRAIEFEGFASSSGKVSLTRFVEFIEKLQQASQQWSSAEPEDVCENAVRIISVHKSKGLEFPVVFLAELDSPFNKRDSQGEILAEVKDTLGLQIIEPESNSRFSSLAHQVIREQKLSAGLAEEMRILYVAMTRARERLVLTACAKKNICRDIICSGYLSGEKTIAEWQLRSCRSTLEWLLYGLCDSKGLHEAFDSSVAVKADRDELFSLKVYGQAQLEQLCEFVVKLKSDKLKALRIGKKQQSKPADSKLLREVKKSLAWRYRFGDAPLLAAKRSVTELTHGDDEYVKFDYSKALDRQPKTVLQDESVGRFDSRIIGTTAHLVIARLDLTRPVTKEAVEKTKEKLIVEAAIPEAAGEYIKAESIIAFFDSQLGRKALDKENKVRREWPFSFAVQADDVCSDEVVIVQGIIDMLIETTEGLAVIDFKTDNITAAEATGRTELYRKQLELYSRAAEAILKSKIAGKWLYFLTPGCTIEI